MCWIPEKLDSSSAHREELKIFQTLLLIWANVLWNEWTGEGPTLHVNLRTIWISYWPTDRTCVWALAQLSYCGCSISCSLVNLSSMFLIAQRHLPVKDLLPGYICPKVSYLVYLLDWSSPSRNTAGQGSLSFQRRKSVIWAILINVGWTSLCKSLFPLFFFLSLSFSPFDNIGSLESKLAGLNLNLGDCPKSPRNLVRKPCLLRPLFSALSLNVTGIEGEKINQQY